MATPKEIEAIVKESGNNFHCVVANYLKEKGWHILVSPYYLDSATNKPREIDLIAEKYWKFTNRSERKFGAVLIRLFIECKYIPQPNVFWFGGKDIAAATEWLVSNTPLRKNNVFIEQHHYLAGCAKVAKLFASKKATLENEVIYKALNQSLNAMVYLRGRESLIPDIKMGRIPVLASLEMPAVFCNSFKDFYRIEMDNTTTLPQKIEENFQLEVNYAYMDGGERRSDFFLIDIIDFERMDQYFDTIDSDKEAIGRIL